MSVEVKKILGIDYGDYNIGLAIFDLQVDFIYPYKTLKRTKANVLRKDLREIIDIVEKEKIDRIIVGLPLNIDGTEGERVLKVKNFIHMLENKLINIKNKNIEVLLQDERLTTKEAEEILTDRNVKKSEQKKVIDQLAAEIILKDYKQQLNKKFYNERRNMAKKDEIITLNGEDGDIQVEVIDQTIIDGVTYLLVADVLTDDEDEGDCYILKDVSKEDTEEACYEVVPDDESEDIFDTFEKMLKEDIDLKK